MFSASIGGGIHFPFLAGVQSLAGFDGCTIADKQSLAIFHLCVPRRMRLRNTNWAIM